MKYSGEGVNPKVFTSPFTHCLAFTFFLLLPYLCSQHLMVRAKLVSGWPQRTLEVWDCVWLSIYVHSYHVSTLTWMIHNSLFSLPRLHLLPRAAIPLLAAPRGKCPIKYHSNSINPYLCLRMFVVVTSVYQREISGWTLQYRVTAKAIPLLSAPRSKINSSYGCSCLVTTHVHRCNISILTWNVYK